MRWIVENMVFHAKIEWNGIGPLVWPSLLSNLPNLRDLDVSNHGDILHLQTRNLEGVRIPESVENLSLGLVGQEWLIPDLFPFESKLPRLNKLYLLNYSVITTEFLQNCPRQLEEIKVFARTTRVVSSWPTLVRMQPKRLSLVAADNSLSTSVGDPWMKSLEALELTGYVSDSIFAHLSPTCVFAATSPIPKIPALSGIYMFLPQHTTELALELTNLVPFIAPVFPPWLTSLTISLCIDIVFDDMENNLPLLTSLDLRASWTYHYHLAATSLPALLKTLRLSDYIEPAFDPALLLEMKHLTEVRMTNWRIHQSTWPCLPPTVTSFAFDLNTVEGVGIRALPDLPHLRRLEVVGAENILAKRFLEFFVGERVFAPQISLPEHQEHEIAERELVTRAPLEYLCAYIPLVPASLKLLPPTLTHLEISIETFRNADNDTEYDDNDWIESDGPIAPPRVNLDTNTYELRLPPLLTYLRIEWLLLTDRMANLMSSTLFGPSDSQGSETLLTSLPLETLIINAGRMPVPLRALESLPKSLKCCRLDLGPYKLSGRYLSRLPPRLRQLILTPCQPFSDEIAPEDFGQLPKSITVLTLPAPDAGTYRHMPPHLAAKYNSRTYFLQR